MLVLTQLFGLPVPVPAARPLVAGEPLPPLSARRSDGSEWLLPGMVRGRVALLLVYPPRLAATAAAISHDVREAWRDPNSRIVVPVCDGSDVGAVSDAVSLRLDADQRRRLGVVPDMLRLLLLDREGVLRGAGLAASADDTWRSLAEAAEDLG